MAIADTRLAPIAYRKSMPNSRVNAGVITTPPPNPVSEPRKPATDATTSRDAANSNEFMIPSIMEAGPRGMDESQPFSLRRTGAQVANSRLVLVAGFGGLLLLMAFAGLDGIQALRQIQTSNDSIREDFLLRTRLLERIRGDVYVSGTYVRDYLLEPESGKAEGHRYSLLETRNDMDAALASYRALLTPRRLDRFRG